MKNIQETTYIRHVDCIDETDIIEFFRLGWAELVLVDSIYKRHIPFNNTDRAIVLYDYESDMILAAISYEYRDGTNKAYINMGYVNPMFRGKDIYNYLFDVIKIYLKNKGAKFIQSYCSPNNEKVIKCFEKQGRKNILNMYQIELE